MEETVTITKGEALEIYGLLAILGSKTRPGNLAQLTTQRVSLLRDKILNEEDSE